MRAMSPKELAESWGIDESEVMQKINNTLLHRDKDGVDKLPETFVVRKYPDCFRVIVPSGYQFKVYKKAGSSS